MGGIHFAELNQNQMSDTEEVAGDEALYVISFIVCETTVRNKIFVLQM